MYHIYAHRILTSWPELTFIENTVMSLLETIGKMPKNAEILVPFDKVSDIIHVIIERDDIQTAGFRLSPHGVWIDLYDISDFRDFSEFEFHLGKYHERPNCNKNENLH
jgi:hypothetical protein